MREPQVCLVVLCLVIGLAVVYFRWWNSEGQRTRRALAAVPRRTVAELRDGEMVKVVGRLLHGPETLSAPLSGRRCALYLARVMEQQGKQMVEVIREARGVGFLLDDGTGTVLVRPERFELGLVEDHEQRSGTWQGDPTPAALSFLAAHGKSPEGTVFQRAFRYHEAVLEQGERVVVLGQVKVEPDPEPGRAGDGYRDLPMRKVLVPPAGSPMLFSDDPDTAAS